MAHADHLWKEPKISTLRCLGVQRLDSSSSRLISTGQQREPDLVNHEKHNSRRDTESTCTQNGGDSSGPPGNPAKTR